VTQYDNTNTGVLFKNDQEGNDKRPAYKGKINIEGRDWEIAGWKKTGKSGVPFLSLKVQLPRPKPQQALKQPELEPFVDDEIPFNFVPF
jgi:uncharacterized protein (DUF736 family)